MARSFVAMQGLACCLLGGRSERLGDSTELFRCDLMARAGPTAAKVISDIRRRDMDAGLGGVDGSSANSADLWQT